MENGMGGSLPVENVQQLASKKLKEIPLRYIRPELHSDEVSTDESLQIPAVDFGKLDLGTDHESAKLHGACKDWGFFQLINHGISEAIEEMKAVTEEFFKLPLEEKMEYSQLTNSIEGYGQAFVVSEDQKLDWGDMLFLIALPIARRNMRFWPAIPPAFRSTLDRYSSELKRVSMRLVKAMAENLGLEQQDDLTSLFEACVQGIRMNYYPPCEHHATKVTGLSPHSDATGITLLVQVNQVPGLQIKKNGKWVPVKPLPDAIIVNIGDIIEIMSNGEYVSIEHRAMVSPETERVSIAGFHSPNMAAMIGPLAGLVKESSEGAKYKTVSHEDYVKLVVRSKLDGKSLLENLRTT